ncbi:hypothetical protein [Streptomyces lydicus]|uniref:hypothetical protein n=1 Tax=Streptomyces lydicus TaxID=47763 RepID=UPI0037A4A601
MFAERRPGPLLPLRGERGGGADAAAVEGHDLVGGEARPLMGDQQRGAAAGGVEDVGEHGGGGFRVEPFGGFVQDEDGRVGEQRAGVT